MSKLSAEKLAKSFKERRVVEDVSLSINKGEIVGLLGPNGAGKTTCFYMIVGLIKGDHGKIFIDNEEITQLPMHGRARKGIGYLPQESSIFRKLSVKDNILAILETRKDITRKQRREKLDELLQEFHLGHIVNSQGISLSGGERRRVEIARALAMEPSYILLDEPFAGVDPISVGDIRTLVHDLKERGIGVLITDHNVRETLEIVDRACIIYDGKVLFAGNPAELVANADVRRLYLGESFSM